MLARQMPSEIKSNLITSPAAGMKGGEVLSLVLLLSELMRFLLSVQVHYNLPFSVALLWLSDLDAQTALTRQKMNFTARNQYRYPNQTEREAMILSAYAGVLLNSIPIEEVLEIYSMKPSAHTGRALQMEELQKQNKESLQRSLEQIQKQGMQRKQRHKKDPDFLYHT
ncbi:unnamed protein product [Bubo scandiacus]